MYICLLGIVTNNSRILLIEKVHDESRMRYILPGGHWDFPESFKKGVEREVFEETGVRVKAKTLKKIIFNQFHNRLELYYLCEITEKPNDQLAPTHFDDENKGIHFKPMFIHKKDLENILIRTLGTKKIVEEFRLS